MNSGNRVSMEEHISDDKKLLKRIRKQLEFYLSDSNLSKDRSMFLIYQDSIVEGGIPMEVFLKCNRVKALVSATSEIEEALKKSKELQVLDGKVSRKLPFQPKTNQDDCTIYVENIPVFATPEWCQKQFRPYGKVEYVSMPKFRSGKLKGYAFVEFKTEDQADSCVTAFKEAGRYIGERDPAQLMSILTFEDDTENENPQDTVTNGDSLRGEGEPKLEIGVEDMEQIEASNQEVDEGVDYLTQFKILTRLDWKKQRNKYLNQSRKEIIAQKRQLWFERMKEQRREKARRAAEAELTKNAPKDINFEAGIIVKISLKEPVHDAKSTKDQIRALGGVKYVDVLQGAIEIKVRCESQEAAKALLKNPLGEGVLLAGAEELDYWRKIHMDREAKYAKESQPEKKKKKKKSEKKQPQHTRFEDNE